MKIRLKIKTIELRHVSQLTPEHYWDGEYKWAGKKVLGRIASDGFVLVLDKGALHKVSPVAYIDGKLEEFGCRTKVNGKWEYAPTPHTEFSRKAQAAYLALPQLFTD